MAKSISAVDSEFDAKRFLKLRDQLDLLEMKPRVRLIRDELKALLPKDYETAIQILLKSARGGKVSGFGLWPYTEFIQTYGLPHLRLSLGALKELTPLFTSEWAVRPFLTEFPKETLSFLLKCAGDQDVHVRRWASEGTRPRLPWGERLHSFVKDPSPSFPILEKLKFDPELYVRKSVSNHLNDIAKDHPELVVQLLSRWKKEAGEEHISKVDWMIHRSLRTLIKNGHAGALSLIGVSTKTQIELRDFKVHQKKIKLGEKVDFEFKIRSLAKKSQPLVVDYVVHFVKANRKTSAKVFKLKKLDLGAGKTVVIKKAHSFKKITTREYYPGVHFLEIQVNGKVLSRLGWKLEL